MPETLDEVQTVEVRSQATLVVAGQPRQYNEAWTVNFHDPEIQDLIRAGLLLVVDDEVRKLLPAPRKLSQTSSGGCGCNS